MGLASEAVVRWGGPGDGFEGWEVMTRLAEELLKRERKLHNRLRLPKPGGGGAGKVTLAAGGFRDYRDSVRPQRVEGEHIVLENVEHVARAESAVVRRPGLSSSLVVTTGPVSPERPSKGRRAPVVMRSCVVFAGGDFEVDELIDSVVVCDGDVRVARDMVRSLVVARGAVRAFAGYSSSNVVVCGGSVEPRPRDPNAGNLVKADERRPLGFVRFFETSRVGLEVAPAKFAVRVARLDRGTAFGEAGLKEGDLVVSVDDSEIGTPDQFRRALRRRIVEGGEVAVRVRRDGEWMTVFVTPRL